MQGINGEHQQQKIYFALIEKAGSWSRYQFSLFFILYGICLLNISINSMLPYLFQQIDYQCHALQGDECTDYVCSLPVSKRQWYVVEDNYISLADDLNMDFRCEHYETAGMLYLAISLTIVCEKLFFSSFSDYFGRKNALLFTTSLMLFGICLVMVGAYIHSMYVSIGGLLIASLSSANSFQSAICIATEVVAQEKRIDYLSWLGTTRGIGLIFNVFVFKMIKDWLSVIIFVFVAPLVFIIVAVTYHVQKTPYDLLSFCGQAQIVQALKRIASYNQERLTLKAHEVKQIKDDYLNLFANNSVQHFSIIDLFRYKSLLKIVFPLMILNLLAGFIYYSSVLLMDNSATTVTNPLSRTQREASIVDGVAAIAAIFLCCLVYKSLLNKQVKIMIGIAMLAIQTSFLLFQDDMGEEFKVVIYFFYSTLVASGFFYITLLNFQMFPTQIRPIGVVFVSLFQDVSDLLQPLINQVYDDEPDNYKLLLMLATFIGVVTIFLMRLDRGDENLEIIEEIREGNGQFVLKQ